MYMGGVAPTSSDICEDDLEIQRTLNKLNSRNYAAERQKNRLLVQQLTGGQIFTINYKKGQTQLEKIRQQREQAIDESNAEEQKKINVLNKYLNGYCEMLAAATIPDPCNI
jgi:hypothetical protein